MEFYERLCHFYVFRFFIQTFIYVYELTVANAAGEKVHFEPLALLTDWRGDTMGRKRKRQVCEDVTSVTSSSVALSSSRTEDGGGAVSGCSPDLQDPTTSNDDEQPPRNAANERERARMRVYRHAVFAIVSQTPTPNILL